MQRTYRSVEMYFVDDFTEYTSNKGVRAVRFVVVGASMCSLDNGGIDCSKKR